MSTGQSKTASMTEIGSNMAMGSATGMLLNYYVLPAWGYDVTLRDAFSIGLVYTALSFIRSYSFRRLFNWFTVRRQLNG